MVVKYRMDKFLFKRGNQAKLPQLQTGEPFLSKDEERLYIGGSNGNIPLPNKQDMDEVTTQLVETTNNIAKLSHDMLERGVNLDNFPRLETEVNDNGRLSRALDTMPNGGVLIVPVNIELKNVKISTNDLTILLLNATMKVDNVEFAGSRSGIVGIHGKVAGYLRIYKLAQATPAGSNVLVFDNHDFTTEDRLYSSYGLLNDDLSPVNITNVTVNTVTVAKDASEELPAGAYIGNCAWTTALKFTGQDNFIKDVTIEYAQGYALEFVGGTARVENVTIENNGLDILRIAEGAKVNFDSCYFGYVYDPAKQSFSIVDNGYVTVTNSTFNRNNSDVEFYLQGESTDTRIYARGCKFIATRVGDRPAKYGQTSWAVVNLNLDVDQNVDSIILDGCEFIDYSQGVIVQPADNKNRIFINEVIIKNSTAFCTPLGTYLYAQCKNIRFEDLIIDSDNKNSSENSFVIIGSDSKAEFNRCKIKNDRSTMIIDYSTLKDCTFENCVRLMLPSTTFAYRTELINTPVTGYPNWDGNAQLNMFDTIIQHNQILTNGDIADYVNVLPAGKGIIDFRLKNGTLSGYIYHNGSGVRMIYDIFLYSEMKGLIGDDWFIPVNSKIKILSATSPTDMFKQVTESIATITSTSAPSGASSITLAGTYGFVVGDYINISLDNNQVHTTKITELSDNVVTLQTPLPSSTSSGKGVCAYRF